ncbi:hypothetical protein [Hymenobacter cellulosivorans]|uniref:SMP-30/Gluconolactonase/LRE-like region domain-containing protein n=1 Tax=Hymenobacter cellulosivorans TaxID=2932249 RepID=A0ABY4FDW4_9BACT|nr:hypothetical protein [Hymenobacter cellulosivorans]UOQ54237.1 hypothetical protein MUN80_05645 [Hymenobacter cellulosivorans]
MAYDSRGKQYFVGLPQLRKIVKIPAKGAATDFWGTAPIPAANTVWAKHLPVLGEVTGLRVDAAHRSLWACASGWGPVGKRAGLWEFDTRSGTLRQLAFVTDTVRQHSFHDLAVTAQGVVYTTDSASGGLYRMRTKMPLTEEIEAWLPADTFVRPTHLCLNAEDNALYVVHAGGLARIALATKQITPVATPGKLAVDSITGLYYQNGYLLVLDNPTTPKLVRYRLDTAASGLVLVDALPLPLPTPPAGPVAGMVVGNEFYYTSTPAANSAAEPLLHISLL